MSSPRSVLASRSLSLVLLLTVLELGVACVPSVEIERLGGDADLNERLRPDLAPLTPDQTSGPPWVGSDGKAFFSDGGASGGELVSELYHSMIPPARLRELRRSRCLFVENGGFPVLSYEVVVGDLDVGDVEVNLDRIALCKGYPNHPETRETLEVNGRSASFAVRIDSVTTGLMAHGGNDVVRNPYGACDEVLPSETLSQTLGADLVGGTTGTYKPFCLLRGSPLEIPEEDTSYVLEVVDPDTGDPIETRLPNWTSTPHPILPHLKVVGGRRTIARPLHFAGRAFDVERNRWVHTYAWAVESVDENGVPDAAGAFWRENFAPSVLVESAAFFVQQGSAPAPEGSPARAYLAIDKLRVAEIGDVGPQQPIPFDSGCDLTDAGDPDGDGSLYLAPCEITATPTYALTPDVNGRMTQKVEWRVQFFTANELDPIPVTPGEPFFIEFRLQAPEFGSQSGALTVDPGYADAGDAQIGTTQRLSRALSIESVGAAGVVVDDIRVVGPDAAAFEFELPLGTEVPFVLPSGRAVELDLLVETTRWGQHEAELVVAWSDAGGQYVDLRAPLYAYGVAADLVVLPRVVSLKRGSAATGPNDHLRNVLVTNPGNAPLVRGRLAMGGVDASFFTVVRSECEGKITTPPAGRCELPPGGMELLTIEYHPLVPGLHDAALTIETNAGTDEVAVLGSCSGFCTYDPPDQGSEPIPPALELPGDFAIDVDDDSSAIDVGDPTSPTLTATPLAPTSYELKTTIEGSTSDTSESTSPTVSSDETKSATVETELKSFSTTTFSLVR
jgi:hypothetical protein